MSVVLAQGSTLVADVLTRALVLLGLDAQQRPGPEPASHEVVVSDITKGEAASLVLASAGTPRGVHDGALPLGVVTRVDVCGASTPGDGAAVDGTLADVLTPRELQVLSLVAAGASNRQIASSLDITPNTARTHVQNVLAKLQVESRLAAGAVARRHGLATSQV